MAEFPSKKPETKIRPKIEVEVEPVLPPGRIDQSVADYLKEHGIKSPPIKFEVFSGAHQTKKDGELAGEHASKMDIFFMEGFGWSERSKKLYNDLASGLIDTDKFIRERHGPGAEKDLAHFQFERGLGDKIYKSGVKVALADLPDRHEEAVRGSVHHGIINKLKLADSFHDALKTVRSECLSFDAQEVTRENYFLENIGPEIAGLLMRVPELQSKDVLRVGVFWGANHTFPILKLTERGDVVDWSSSGSFVGDNFLELRERQKNNKEISPLLVARVYLEWMSPISKKLISSAGNELPLIGYSGAVRKIVDEFSFDEIKEYFDIKNPRLQEEYFEGILKKKNIRIPTDAEEFKAFADFRK